MTKKDYKILAEAINRSWRRTFTSPGTAQYDMVNEIADELGKQNPRFDRKAFDSKALHD